MPFPQGITQRLLIAQAFFFTLFPAWSQESYFQQELSYTLSVQLNDRDHSLRAEEQILYTNRSDSSLNFIWMHLWPNAYKDRNSALCRQLLDQNKKNLYYAKEEQRGYIDSLDFRVNGKPAHWEYHPIYFDLCQVRLTQALLPGESIVLSTPFYVKIPSAMFSRFGHIDQAYYVSQWYPKPAVFDKAGWHLLPYLDQGEFYSEYGSFDVRISLPANYVLAATGDRVEAEKEISFLSALEEKTRELMENEEDRPLKNSLPESDSIYKTVRFTQNRVHDFAWFADKRYLCLNDQVELPNSGRVVDTWVFFTPENLKYWKKAIGYVNDAVLFYSRKLGDYPYHHATAVDGTIMAGGGMEYPNITVIGTTQNDMMLDVTITHEVGHNWFYGILGSNERDHPFMDEGINSFYEMEYIRQKYPNSTMAEVAGLPKNFAALGLNKMPFWREKELTYFMSLKANYDQPLNLGSENYTAFNYGALVYSKTALLWDYLKEYLGEEKFDKAMQSYYRDYRFKHPGPEALFSSLSMHSGVDLSAFKHYFIDQSLRIDYKVKRINRREDGSYSLLVKNKGAVAAPFSTLAYKNNRVVASLWSNGIEQKGRIEFPPVDADYFRVDGNMKLPDFRRRNNIIQTKGFLKKHKPLRLHLFTSIENEEERHLNLTPASGFNMYNGYMLGLNFHNYSLYKKSFEYYLVPMYAFRSKNLSGMAELAWNIFPARAFTSWTIGTRVKKFAYEKFDAATYNSTYHTNLNPFYCDYLRIKPFVEYNWKSHATSKFSHNLELSTTLLITDSLTFLKPGLGAEKRAGFSWMNRMVYTLDKRDALDPYSIRAQLWQKSGLVKLSAEYKQTISLSFLHRLEFRLFAGTFISGQTTEKAYYAFRASGYSGYQDVLFDQQFLGRNERDGLAFSQFSEEDAALKVWTPLGQSTTWLLGINFKSPKLLRLPVKLYADAAFTDAYFLNKDAFLWNAGINLSILPSVFEVYFPLIYSADIKETLELNGVDYLQSIRFTLNIHNFRPGKLLSEVIGR